jgi:sugar/nucleoside kinase (ribokinase family)
MKEKLKQIQDQLQNASALLASKKIAAGFDGFVDSIVRVVNFKTEVGGPVFFNTIKEFGNYIAGKSGSGFSLESEELVQKLGGNMPIMANAMAQMGTSVNCVGAFGVPSIAPVFSQMHPNCSLHTYTNPGFTTAMEFTDGKIMLAQMTDLNHSDWNTIKNAIGLEKLREIFINADLVCLVNWSELDHSNNIWEGLLADVFAGSNSSQKKFFFDLSDCSKRKPEAITSAIKLIEQFGKYGKVTLSLNRNEANILYQTLINHNPPIDLQAAGNKLFTELNIDTLIAHSSKLSASWDANGTYMSEPVFIANPKFSTGAGDNFNAGYCMATLIGLDAELSLIMANCVANYYITTGDSPDVTALNTYISGLINNIA